MMRSIKEVEEEIRANLADRGIAGPTWNESDRYVVFDNRDGYLFQRDSSGKPWTFQTATEYAIRLNKELKPEYGRTYQVARIQPIPRQGWAV